MARVVAILSFVLFAGVAAGSDGWKRTHLSDPVLKKKSPAYVAERESFDLRIHCAPAPYATIVFEKLKKKDSEYLTRAREANALFTMFQAAGRPARELPMPFRRGFAFPDALNLDGTGAFLLDLIGHDAARLRIPISPDSSLTGEFDGHALLSLLRDDPYCDVEGIDIVIAHRRGILDGRTESLTDEPVIAGTDGVSNPRLVKKVPPQYPQQARAFLVEGSVVLQAIVLEDGGVGEIEVLTAKPARVGFEKAAIDAVRQWRYRPARENGIPIPVWFTIKVDFTIQ